MSVIQSKKTDYNKKINEIEKKITEYDHDKYIATPEFNKPTAENFAARLTPKNSVTKTDFEDKLKNLNQKINSNKTKHLLVENEIKNQKHLIQSIFVVKFILKTMVLKIVQCFRQHIDILKGLLILMIIISYFIMEI